MKKIEVKFSSVNNVVEKTNSNNRIYMKTNLKDITFIIPIRIDSLFRLENLMLSLEYITKHFDTNIIVLEADKYKNSLLQKLLNKNIQYLFIEDKDPIFYRTWYLNFMSLKVESEFIGIWDADIIINKNQIVNSINKLKAGFDVIYPYDGRFYDTTSIIRELYIRDRSIKIFQKNRLRMELPYGENMVGGAIFINKLKYLESGLENLNYYGWGPEDGERFNRWKNLDYKILFINGPLFHLTHPRGINSLPKSKKYALYTRSELIKTRQNSKIEQIEQIKASNGFYKYKPV